MSKNQNRFYKKKYIKDNKLNYNIKLQLEKKINKIKKQKKYNKNKKLMIKCKIVLNNNSRLQDKDNSNNNKVNNMFHKVHK